MTRKHLYTAPLALAGLLVSAPAFAQEAVLPEAAEAVSGGTAYILNTLLFLIGGFLVMWMAAGFAMLEPDWCVRRTSRSSVSRTSGSTRLRA